jgi:hypothetical protein
VRATSLATRFNIQQPLNTVELHSDTEIKKRAIFDALIEGRWGTSMSAPPEETYEDTFEEYWDNDKEQRFIPEVEDTVDSNGRLINQQPLCDQIINAEVQLQQDNQLCTGRVVRSALGPDGTTAGSYADNPILNSIIYEVEFPDGQMKEYAANTT